MSEPDVLLEITVTFPADVDEEQIQEVVAEFAKAVREATHPTPIH